MNDWLNDLYPHQAWADAEHWHAIGAVPTARDDQAIRQRLYHLHFVQHAFLWTVGDRAQPFRMMKPEDFPTFESLQAYAREFHEQAPSVVSSLKICWTKCGKRPVSKRILTRSRTTHRRPACQSTSPRFS